MPPNRFESEVESFLEGSHGDRTHIKRADHPRLHHYAGRYLAYPGGRVAPLVFRAPEGPAAREIATREPAARSGRSRSPPVPSGPSGSLHSSGAWLLMCGLARRLEARPGPATAHGHRSQALRSLRCPPQQTAVARRWAGNSRETAIAFAGVCFVSGETDDTIASQIHLFSAQFWRAKASWE